MEDDPRGHPARGTSRGAEVPKDTTRATVEVQRRAAIRGADDPAELSRATRIVRVAVTRGQVALDELAEPIRLDLGPTVREQRAAKRAS